MKEKFYTFLLLLCIVHYSAQLLVINIVFQEPKVLNGWSSEETNRQYQEMMFKKRYEKSYNKDLVVDILENKQASGAKLSEEELAFLQEMEQVKRKQDALIQKDIEESAARHPLILKNNLAKIKVNLQEQEIKYNYLLFQNLFLAFLITVLLVIFFKKSAK